ncbi:hypothetical protein BU26DRAFT_507024 [Trematosphaeria pertusa]|uniref:RING-type domain-containing protein n=1 Tax=Trematosphaeria pertusa TaxID=390896 RepID=A0A6A6I8L4_9PLEO|nr:uncharacterized protein BU26DRAFT_507024 [Trematosphaeria pertusa]KAF2246418.1 hypothetical protein BU26DRAFT_507024 [Trematosphaeria pertusa]
MDAQQPTEETQAAETAWENEFISRWIDRLKHTYSFQSHDKDPKCPFGAAMMSFQHFTTRIILALEARDPGIVNMTKCGYLRLIYSRLPSFHNLQGFHAWVADAVLKHPQRRNMKQHQWLAIVDYERLGGGLLRKCKMAFVELNRWFREVSKPENLVRDPDQLYLFRRANGLKAVKTDRVGDWEHQECQVCTEEFERPDTIEGERTPQRAPCGHVLCKACFKNWLEQSKGRYTCPLCRACLVCGENNCIFHSIRREPTTPMPMPDVLRIIRGRSEELLHGLAPSRYWVLRETTRYHRVCIRFYNRVLDRDGADVDDPVYQHYQQRRDEHWDTMKGEILGERMVPAGRDEARRRV